MAWETFYSGGLIEVHVDRLSIFEVTGLHPSSHQSLPTLAGISIVLAARFPANTTPLNAEVLASLAIKSAHELDDGRDGISYLLDAKRNGTVTPLSGPYEREILRRMKTASLEDALQKDTRRMSRVALHSLHWFTASHTVSDSAVNAAIICD